MTKFAAGCDIGVRGDYLYAVDCMALCDTPTEAVREQARMHSSFGYMIYEVEDSPTAGVERRGGIRGGTKCHGYKIIGKGFYAFEHPAWEDAVRR